MTRSNLRPNSSPRTHWFQSPGHFLRVTGVLAALLPAAALSSEDTWLRALASTVVLAVAALAMWHDPLEWRYGLRVDPYQPLRDAHSWLASARERPSPGAARKSWRLAALALPLLIGSALGMAPSVHNWSRPAAPTSGQMHLHPVEGEAASLVDFELEFTADRSHDIREAEITATCRSLTAPGSTPEAILIDVEAIESNLLRGTARVDLADYGRAEIPTGSYLLVASIAAPDGVREVTAEYNVPYANSCDDAADFVTMGSVWEVRESRFVADLGGTEGHSEGELVEAFWLSEKAVFQGRLQVGHPRDGAESTSLEERQRVADQGLEISIGGMLSVVICDGFPNSFSIKVGREVSRPSDRSQSNEVNERTDFAVEFGAWYDFEIHVSDARSHWSVELFLDHRALIHRFVDREVLPVGEPWKLVFRAWHGFAALDDLYFELI